MNKDILTSEIIGMFCSELKISDVAANSDFLSLGGDSLGIMSVIAKLEDKYAVELDPRAVLTVPTPESIAALVVSVKNESADEADNLSSVTVDLISEAILPDDICAHDEYLKHADECASIFLTGATGFLGAFLIKDILTRSPDTVVYCLTRCHDFFDGLDRIKMNMIHYKCWDNTFRVRIIPVKGDLTLPYFGLDEKTWNELSLNIDMIFHCGAVLNFLYPYTALKKSNVLSTIEVLRLACSGRMKYVNYASSYSVYDNPSHFGKNALEDDELNSPDGYFLGYSQSKWVAEKLMRKAQERGIKSKIYRPGDITGTKQDGIWAVRDLTSRMIIGCIQMKMVPMVNMPLNFTPVDYVSAAMTHIAFSRDGWDKAYNIINPNIGSSSELLKAIYSCKKAVLPVPYKLWKGILKKSNAANNALKILSCMFEDTGNGDIITRHMEKQPVYDMFNTRSALADSNIECPPMDASLLKSYINYFKTANLI